MMDRSINRSIDDINKPQQRLGDLLLHSVVLNLMVFGLFSPNSPGDDLLMPAQLLQQNDEFGIAMCNSKIKKKEKKKEFCGPKCQ